MSTFEVTRGIGLSLRKFEKVFGDYLKTLLFFLDFSRKLDDFLKNSKKI